MGIIDVDNHVLKCIKMNKHLRNFDDRVIDDMWPEKEVQLVWWNKCAYEMDFKLGAARCVTLRWVTNDIG